jgi:hypothetical protein
MTGPAPGNKLYGGKMKHKWFTLVSAVSLIVVGLWALPSRAAQTSVLWYDVRAQNIAASGTRDIIPDRYRMLRLNELALRQLLTTAPLEGTSAAHSTAPIIDLPLPDGGFGRFRFVESPIMVPELAAKFPKIKTYAGQGLDDETATVRFDVTPAGFHAQILSAHGAMYIDPYSRGTTAYYISYAKRDFKPAASKGFSELAPPPDDRAMAAEIASLVTHNPNTAVGPQLRTYRLAVAATGEYTLYQGGSAAQGLAAIVTSVNRVDGIYETEVAVRMVLVANNNLIVYTNSDTDPYTNGDPYSLLSENQANLDAVIGNANYDVGHVFSTAGGGLAQLGVPCAAGFKAQGETGTSAPVGDPFDVDYVAHEMGHQFGGNHTFNGNAGSCGGGNRNGPTAYEPGSGSTIMAYAGICGAQDLQPHSDAFFHTISFDEIVAYTTVGSGNSCAAITTTGNAAPLPNAGAGYTIPRQTPFTLTGSATDPNGDPVTYNWEEFDLGSAGAPNNPLNPPFFRSFNSTVSPARTFPKWSDIVNNTTTIGEILPNVTRSLVFRLTVRDNRSGGGGVDRVATTINVTTAAGPFQVTVPNTAVTWAGNSSQNVTWNVANTTASPINCATVNIRLSTDGGYTYPVSLASGVSNNGSASISVPNISTTTARVQVACASNIFFDISNVNFTIVPSVADVMLGQTITPTLVRPNSLITYTLTITNASASSSSIITVTDNLPTTGFNLGSASGTGWTCAPLSQVVTCTLPALSANGVTTINLTGTVTAATGTLTNTAWVTSTSDQVPGNNGPITLVTAITPLLDQTITFNPLPDRTYGDPDFVITATASSGLPVSFVAGAPDRCTNIGSTIHLTGAGTCTVTATQAGEGIYGPASPVSRTFQISQALSSVSLTSAPNPAMVLRPITFTATVTSTAGTPTGAVQLYADGALFGYPIALSSGSATWVTHTLTVGTHIITATYSGAGNYTSSTSTLAGGQVVEPIRLYLPVIWR